MVYGLDGIRCRNAACKLLTCATVGVAQAAGGGPSFGVFKARQTANCAESSCRVPEHVGGQCTVNAHAFAEQDEKARGRDRVQQGGEAWRWGEEGTCKASSQVHGVMGGRAGVLGGRARDGHGVHSGRVMGTLPEETPPPAKDMLCHHAQPLLHHTHVHRRLHCHCSAVVT